MRINFEIRNPFKKASNRSSFSVNSPLIENAGEEAVRKFVGVNRKLTSLDAKTMPHDPYELSALMQANGYHARAIRLKVAATVGQGYEASPALREKIDRPNDKYNFQTLLRKTAYDHRLTGNHYVDIIREGSETALFHRTAIKTRVIDEDWFMIYDYKLQPKAGKIAYVKMPRFEEGAEGEGMRQFKLMSESGNDEYGDPDYVSIKPLLALNNNIIKSALLFYKRGLQVDQMVVSKGADLDAKQEQDIRDAFNQSFTGVANSRKTLIVNIGRDEEIDFKKLQSELQEQSTRMVRADNRDEVATAHGVPPRLLGIISAGSLGGTNEVFGQLELFKLLFANDAQREVEEWWQNLFEDLGFPDPESFMLKPIYSVNMADLAMGVQTGIIGQAEAQEDWNREKSFRTSSRSMASAHELISLLRSVNKELQYGQ